MCNCDYYGISKIHGQLIRESTLGCGDLCDYLVVGDQNPIAAMYETVTDEGGFLRSRRKDEDEAPREAREGETSRGGKKEE